MKFPRLYTVVEVAALLRVHPETVLRRIWDGELHGVRIGRLWRVREDDLRDYIGSI